MLRALWGGPETVIVISSDLSHYHPHEVARALDDQTIAVHCGFASADSPLAGPVAHTRSTAFWMC